MTLRPTEGSEEPEAVDPVMLAVLANRGRNATLLSPEQERLLDDWVAGELAPEAAERAAELVRRNALAAERVLERRLLDAAHRSSPVPQALEPRILGGASAARSSPLAGWWRSLGRRQWLGIASVVALACVAAIAVAPMLQQTMPVQVAMVTIADRNPLFESSDIRMRGTGQQQVPPSDQRFRDVEVPTSLLRAILAAADGSAQAAAVREIEPYLPNAKQPLYVIVDSTLRQRLDTDAGRDRLSVRLYDLNDPRTSDIRSLVGTVPEGRHAYLVTVKP